MYVHIICMYVILKFRVWRDREKNDLLHNHGLRRRVNEAAVFPMPESYLFRISGRITFLYEGRTQLANTSRQSDRIKTWNIAGVSLSPARSYVKMNKISVSCARGSHGSRSRPVSRIWFRTFLAYKSAGKLGNKSLRARFRIWHFLSVRKYSQVQMKCIKYIVIALLRDHVSLHWCGVKYRGSVLI